MDVYNQAIIHNSLQAAVWERDVDPPLAVERLCGFGDVQSDTVHLAR